MFGVQGDTVISEFNIDKQLIKNCHVPDSGKVREAAITLPGHADCCPKQHTPHIQHINHIHTSHIHHTYTTHTINSSKVCATKCTGILVQVNAIVADH